MRFVPETTCADILPFWRLYPTDGSDPLDIGENTALAAMCTAISDYLTTGVTGKTINYHHPQLGYRWLTISEAVVEYDLEIRTLRAACERGAITDAVRNADGVWMFPEVCLRSWVRNPLARKRGPAGAIERAIAAARQGLSLRERVYPEPLPEELLPFYCYPVDAGHSILAVPVTLLDTHSEIADLLTPLPVKTVLRGYEMQHGFPVALHARYDETLGAVVNPDDEEF